MAAHKAQTRRLAPKTTARRRIAERKGLDEDVADSLRDAILKGELKPGERVTELGLADLWQVSQGTVRAALKTLQHEGLVEYRPRRGTSVASITEADLFEIYTLRDALGGLAAERAAARVTPAEQQVLRQILTEMEEAAAAGNRRRMLDLDFRFHRAIVDMCDHARLAQMYTNLETQTRLFLTMTEMLHHSLDDSVMLHRDLAEAIIAGDPDRAYKLGRRHSERDAKELASALFHSQEG